MIALDAMGVAWLPPHTWGVLSILAALFAIRIGVRRAAGAGTAAGDVRYTPQTLPPRVFGLLVLGSAVGLAVVTAPLPPVPALVLHGGGVAAVAVGSRWVARLIYRRRLQRQVLPAFTALAQQCTGVMALFPAFRALATTLPWPIGAEWQWVVDHVHRPVDAVGDTPGRRYVDHAHALRALAATTPLEIHAYVLDQMAAWYDYGHESTAGSRLRRIVEMLDRRERLYRSVLATTGRVRGEAWIISAIMLLLVGYLVARNPEQVLRSLATPWGPLVVVWFVGWLLAPPLVALLLVRRPDVGDM